MKGERLDAVRSDERDFVGFDVDYRNGKYTPTGYAMADIPRIQETVSLILTGAWDEDPVNVSVSEDTCG